MAKTNLKPALPVQRTHNGAIAPRIDVEAQLKRSVLACMLWENEFYESGKTISDRIKALVHQSRPGFVAALAYHARTEQKLRHVPLLLLRELARHPKLDTAEDHEGFVIGRSIVRYALAEVIQRPDEIGEFLSIYWKTDAKRGERNAPVSAQVKRGLAAAFSKFSAFELAKYDRQGDAVRLRDVAFLTHVKAGDDVDRGQMFARLLNKDRFPTRTKSADFPVKQHYKLTRKAFSPLDTPDTWETNLSAGADKRETFERLMQENRLGALAFLRNLRNMEQSNVDRDLIREYAKTVKVDRVLPFRFITAARIVPMFEDVLEPMMFRCVEGQPKIAGRTFFAIDVSQSMEVRLSAKSETLRMDAAIGLGVLGREVCEQAQIFTFSDRLVQVPPRRGFALAEAINKSQPHHSTRLIESVRALLAKPGDMRLIVITDEQANVSHLTLPKLKEGQRCYVVNVASEKNGVGYGNGYVHIDGWSEAVLDYIRECEAADAE